MGRVKNLFKRAVNALLIPLLVIGGLPLQIKNVTAAEGDDVPSTVIPEDAPAHGKDLHDNGDGTYTLSLSVTGKADTTTHQEVTKSNIVLVIDTSNSMNSSTGGYGSATRLEAEKDALTKTDGIIDKLLANNTSEIADIVELYGVNFGTSAATAWNWSTNGTTIKNAINGLDTNSGTNWEEALILAKEAADAKHAAEPDENTYVIFMTDGEPTTHQNDYSVNTRYREEWDYAKDDARGIVTAGYTFYGIFTFGSGTSSSYLKSLVNYAYTGTGTYNSALSSDYAGYFYDATDTQGLIDALEAIVDEISSSVGYTNIAMTDGLTALTSSMKVDGKISNLTYTRSGGNYGSGTVWAEAPEAETTNGTISWNLGSTVLEDGVTYTVSFVVWPAQESYDLIADLNNGKISYDSLTPSQKASITDNQNGTYSLKTNTDYPTLTYSTITTTTSNEGTTTVVSDPKTFSITNPKPVGLQNEKLNLEKKWEDSLDPSQREEVAGEVVLDFYKDGVKYRENIHLTEESNWKLTDYISVAPGVMISSSSANYSLLKGDHTEYSFNGKTYIILEEGHDYYFDEHDLNNHFELTNYIYHPMVVDGTVQNVFFTRDDAGNITGIEKLKSMDSVSATNTLKGGINVQKRVEDKDGNVVDTDDSFEITIHLVDEDGKPYAYDYRIYFGEKNPNYNNEEFIETRPDGTVVHRTGHIRGTGDITETIYLGDTIRIVNVDSGVKYYVEETDKDGYSATPTIEYEERNGDATTFAPATAVNGYYVVSGNTASSATVVNTFLDEKTQVDFEKTWYDADGNVLSGDDLPGKITIELFKKGADGIKVSTGETKEVSAETDWKGSFTELTKYDNGVTIVYSVEESAIEGATYDDEQEAFFTYEEEENNGKHAVVGRWKVETLEDHILKNTWTPATSHITGTTSFNIVKVDKTTGEPLEGAKFELKLKDGTTFTATTNSDGEATFDDLAAGEYTLKETDAPTGYKQIAGEPSINITSIRKLNTVDLVNLQNLYEYVYSFSVNSPDGYEYSAENRTFTVENELIPYDDITVTKVWEDEDNHDGARPTELTITLIADGEDDESYKLTAADATEDDANTWTHIFKHKPTTTVTGAVISYTIKEDETVLGDYEADYDEEEDPLTITNSYTPKTIDITGNKTWVYNGVEENLRPKSIKIGLYDERNSKVDETTVTVDADGNWEYSFTGKPVYRNEDGVVSKITYTVKEIEVEGTTYDNDTTFYTYDTEENNGKYAVKGKWVVKTLEDYILENTWTPATETVTGLTSLTVVKIDASTEETLSGAVFTLKADDGTETEGTTGDDGTFTFENLDAGTYTLTETTAPEKHILLDSSSTITITKIKKLMNVDLASLLNTYEYEFTTTTDDADGYTFDEDKNTFTVENEPIAYDDITVYKVWDDSDDRDSNRPTSVTITLIGSDGSEYEATLNAEENATEDDENKWSYLFEEIPMVTNTGETISYTISEDETTIGDYKASYDQDNFTVTNTYEAETVDIYGYKVWKDGDNISGLRPTTLEFKLLDGDDNEVDSVIIFEDEEGNWNFSFEGLPKNHKLEDGTSEEIEYKVQEVVDINYTVSYDEDEDGTIIVTNTLKGHGSNPPETPDTGRVTKSDDGASATVSYGIGYFALVLLYIIANVFSRSKAKRK